MRFAFVGDIYLGPREEPWLSADVPDLHRELGVDVVVGNFESVVDGTEVGCPHPGKIHLSTPRSSLAKLKDMGVDVVSVANNHIGDYGPRAARHTIEVLGEVFGGKNVFGWSGRPTTELAPGLRVAAAVFTETNPVVPDGESRISTARDLEGLLSGGPDSGGQLVVYAHWGEEYLSLTDPELRRRARDLRAAGVSHVVGTHSHVVGASEVVGRFSASYSLGNFLFHVTRKGNTKMLRRATRGAAAVFSWDGTAVTLDGFRGSAFDANLNLRLSTATRRYPGTLVSQMHLRAAAPVASWTYRASQKSQWLSLGLARLIEGVERPSLKKLRTLTAQLRRR
jgi:hypothetical protein